MIFFMTWRFYVDYYDKVFPCPSKTLVGVKDVFIIGLFNFKLPDKCQVYNYQDSLDKSVISDRFVKPDC